MIADSGSGSVPVITIDGPTASGKGTVAQRVAEALGWSVLDSGALYRLVALASKQHELQSSDEHALAAIARDLDVHFNKQGIYLAGREVGDVLRTEEIGQLASEVAALGGVRAALLQRQRDFRKAPGLVADGRDMGTVVFPDAPLKIFLVADVVARAQRRCKQLSDKGISVNLSRLTEDMRERDRRDRLRAHAPLVAAPGAHTIDSSDLTVEETVSKVLGLWSGNQVPA